MGPTGRGWVDIPIAVAAALAAYQFLWRKGVRPVLNGLKKLGRTADDIVYAAHTVPVIEQRLHAVDVRVQRIENEVKTNGGFSLRDVVDRVEAAQEVVRQELVTRLDGEHDPNPKKE